MPRSALRSAHSLANNPGTESHTARLTGQEIQHTSFNELGASLTRRQMLVSLITVFGLLRSAPHQRALCREYRRDQERGQRHAQVLAWPSPDLGPADRRLMRDRRSGVTEQHCSGHWRPRFVAKPVPLPRSARRASGTLSTLRNADGETGQTTDMCFRLELPRHGLSLSWLNARARAVSLVTTMSPTFFWPHGNVDKSACGNPGEACRTSRSLRLCWDKLGVDP